MIELKHISKWYNVGGKPTFILKDINLTIKEGEFISIMGPSGSGKSTLLNIIGMLDLPSEGAYTFLDQSVYDLKEKQRTELYKRYIGFVFQFQLNRTRADNVSRVSESGCYFGIQLHFFIGLYHPKQGKYFFCLCYVI